MDLPSTFKDLPIEWDRVTEPQDDDYPIQVVRKLAAESEKYGIMQDGSPNMVDIYPHLFARPNRAPAFDGFVSVAHKKQPSSARHQPAPLDHEHIDAISDVLWKLWPSVWREAAALIEVICVELDDSPIGRGYGCSCGPVGYDDKHFGGISTTINTVLGGAEGIVHELGHWKLHALGIHITKWNDVLLLTGADARFDSCIRKDKPRPMGACLHALHSYLYVAELVLRYAIDDVERDDGLVNWLCLQVDRISDGHTVCDAGAMFTPDGAQWWRGVTSWCNSILARANALIAEHEENTQ